MRLVAWDGRLPLLCLCCCLASLLLIKRALQVKNTSEEEVPLLSLAALLQIVMDQDFLELDSGVNGTYYGLVTQVGRESLWKGHCPFAVLQRGAPATRLGSGCQLAPWEVVTGSPGRPLQLSHAAMPYSCAMQQFPRPP